MISVGERANPLDPKSLVRDIKFTPRPGFERVKSLNLNLKFAHVCPSCGNVIQAFFDTSEEVDLWPYEETRQMSISQDVNEVPKFRHMVPGPKDQPGKTQYNSYFDRKNGSQKIVLKNHILKYGTIDLSNVEEKADWETGGKMCEWAGLFSLREDLLVRDYVLFSRINEALLYKYKAEKVSDMKFDAKLKVAGHPVPAIGDAPPVILIRFNIVNRGWENAVRSFMGHLKEA